MDWVHDRIGGDDTRFSGFVLNQSSDCPLLMRFANSILSAILKV
jgi:hypothetical protein